MSVADSLTVSSRGFYERAKIKVAFSIFIASFALMLLGFCSTAGGLAASNQQLYQESSNNGTIPIEVKRSYEALISGYGFASAMYIMGCIMCIAAAIYISPVACGYLFFSTFDSK